MLAEEKDKTEQGMQKLRKDYRALSVELFDIELDILDKGDELEELKKPLDKSHRKCQRGAMREHEMLEKHARCKAEYPEKERKIKE